MLVNLIDSLGAIGEDRKGFCEQSNSISKLICEPVSRRVL